MTPSPLTEEPPKRIIWSPQKGPQKLLIDCPLPEIFYGGARGGGKTDGVLGKFALKAKRYGKHFNAVFFRKEMPQQDDLVERAKEIYLPIGARWKEQHKSFLMPQGGRVRFRPLETIQDAEKYQGQNLTDAAVEEAGNYPFPAPIDRLNGVLRSSHMVPTQLLLTGNPGGPGQGWIKQRYIDPAPLGMKVLIRELPNGKHHRFVFIPSKVRNNQILLKSDPEYINRLYLVGSPQLVRAWLEGDWTAVEGAYFPEFSMEKHVVKPLELPKGWLRFRAMDWGSARPFSVGWYAVSDGELNQFPKGALVKYREWYGMMPGQINVGLKMTADEVGKGIRFREKDEEVRYGVLDPSAWAGDGGPSIAERIGLTNFMPADNKRVGQGGAMGGWDQLRSRLKGEDEKPAIYFFDTCVHTIRTLPLLQHDLHKPEDVDTDGEDHAADETRYACMARPWVQAAKKIPERPKFLEEMTANDVFWPKDRNPTKSERL